MAGVSAWLAIVCWLASCSTLAFATTDCGAGWMYSAQHQQCYYVNSTAQMTWHEAYQWCTTMNGNLASVHSSTDESFLVGHRYGLSEVWIGLHNRDPRQTGQYVWTDNSPLNYTHWPARGSSSDVQEACIAIRADGYWDATSCSLQLGLVCQRSVSKPLPVFNDTADVNISTSTQCGGWYEHRGYCYQYFGYRVRWADARSRCFKQGSYLIDVLSADEISYVTAFGLAKRMRSVWMGLNSRLNESVFVWDDGTVSGHSLSADHAALNWAIGEPNNNYGSEHCTETSGYPTLKWNDLRCTTYRNYMCKRRKTENGTYPDRTPAKPTMCPSGYKKYHDTNTHGIYCYVRHGTTYSSRKSWADAKAACEDNGQELASISDYAENAFIHNNLMVHTSYYWYYGSAHTWIGLADPGETGYYQWSDDSAVSFVRWSYRQPSQYRNSDCAYIYRYTDKWFTSRCSYRQAYICKITLVAPRSSGPKAAVGKFCSAGWRLHAGYCYYVDINKVASRSAAMAACAAKSADLASIHSFGEQAFVASLLAAQSTHGDAYLGLSDLSREGEFLWSDSSRMDYSFWAKGQPNGNNNKPQDCVKMYQHRGSWNDVSCNTSLSVICKKSADQAVPAQGAPSSKCRKGWSQFDGKCFKVFVTKDTFAHADASCALATNKHGLTGSLAAVVNRADNFFLSSVAVDTAAKPTSFWIGLNDRGSEGVYQWTSKQPITFVNWAYQQPNDGALNSTIAGEDCVAFAASTSQWSDAVCASKLPYICMVPDDDQTVKVAPTKPSPVSPTAKCAPGWIRYRDACYGFFGTITNATVTMKYPVITPQTWVDAKDVCLQRGASLASIHDTATENFLATTFDTTLKSGVLAYWIGLSALDAQKGGYFWSDGSPVDYTHWAVQEPNDRHGTEDCAEVLLTSRRSAYWRRWNDYKCTAKRAFVCAIAPGKPIQNPGQDPTVKVPSGLAKILCEKGWLQTDDSCYTISYKKTTWTQARRKCEARGKGPGVPAGVTVSLASIHNPQDHITVVQTLMAASISLDNTTSFWIGLNDRVNESMYVWSDDAPVDYLPWSIGEPNDYNHRQDCVQIKGSYGYLFNDAACSNQYYYVCGHSRFLRPTTTPSCPPATQCHTSCPADWLQYDGSCYRKIDVKMDYQEAVANCSLSNPADVEDGDLVTINSKAEQRWLTQHLFTEGEYYWIGLSDEDEENHWRWGSGDAVLYTNWDPTQPNNYRNGEDCGAADGKTNGKWFDRPCDSFYRFVCQISAQLVTFTIAPSATAPATTTTTTTMTTSAPATVTNTKVTEPVTKVTPAAPTTTSVPGAAKDKSTGKSSKKSSGPGPVATALIGVLVTLAVVGVVVGVVVLVMRHRRRVASGLAGSVGFRRLNGDDDDDDDDNLLVE